MIAPICIILSVAFIGLWAITKRFWKSLGYTIFIAAFYALWWATAVLLWAAH